jgi:hypothetical protein
MSIRIATTACSRSTGTQVGLVICEDLWFAEPIASTVAGARNWCWCRTPRRSSATSTRSAMHFAGAACTRNRRGDRLSQCRRRARTRWCSTARRSSPTATGTCIRPRRAFTDQWLVVDFDPATRRFTAGAVDGGWRRKPRCAGLARGGARHPRLLRQERLQACAWLGLSGGIDSSLVLAIAVDALGAENVTGGAHALALHRRPFERPCTRNSATRWA